MTYIISRFSGRFYTANQQQLTRQIKDFISTPDRTVTHPTGLLVPHAGYVYSGQTAAYAYKQVLGERYQRVIILGPSHQSYHQTLAIPQEEGYITPLGHVEFDTDCIRKLTEGSCFTRNSSPHYQEHSLEVQIPFLQVVLPATPIVPISVGNISTPMIQTASEILSQFLTPDTLFVISTDLSHYHSLQQANIIDQKTIESILAMDFNRLAAEHDRHQIECCGIMPIALWTYLISHLNSVTPVLIHYDTSASASFDDTHVVGYVSIAYI